MSGPGKKTSQAWKPPTHFEEYRILSPLSKGGMGEVFLGHDTLLDRAVAIKFIGAQRPDEKTREQFLTEARAAARLQHPNVVSIYRVGEWGGRPYIISEYVRGQTLNSLPAPMEWHRVLDLGIGLSSGLAAAHRSGVLHRDIKPSNAIISLNGEVKLLDFGLAEFVEGGAANLPRPAAAAPPASAETEDASSGDAEAAASAPIVGGVRADGSDYNIASYSGWLDEITDKRKAATGLTPKIVGTPHYMAPEIWRGEPSTRQSDIYAMGSLLFELLAGSPPHYDPTASLEDLRDACNGRDALPLVDLVPGIDPRLSAVVARCLSRSAAGRYTSGDELRAALEELRPSDTKSVVPEGNPYRGLFAFEAEHRSLFFGRTNEIGTVIERLRTEPFILVAADSGIGKSSLCRAGILPLIDDGALGGGRDWQVVSFVPGRAPLLSLSTALAPLFGVSELMLAEMLRTEPTGLSRELHKQLGDELGVVLFIDQLEELVTISDPEEVNLVGQALGRLAQRIPGVRLLMTARSDFLARIATVPALGDELSRALYFLRPMYAEKIRQAIVGPARKKSVRFESEALVDALISETAKTDGGLPLLQFALTELWDARTGDLITQHSLEAIGGVAGALARHADQVLVSLPAEQRLAARRILLSLVTIEGTRARRTDEEIGQTEAAQKALEALLRGRMIVAHATSDGTVYEVAHEALLKGWGTLRNWLVEFAESRAVKQRLESAAAEWMRLGRAREALWSSLQLAELHILDRHEFTTRERAFVEASEHARRRGRLLRNAGIVAVPLIFGLFYGGMQLKLSRERNIKVEAHLKNGRSLLELARHKDAELVTLRRSALQAFDEQQKDQGEKIWARVLALATETEARYGRASQALEAALTVDPSREDARELLADALFESALCAERSHHPGKRDDLVQRMALYDLQGVRQKRLLAPARLTLHTQPEGAQVMLQRYQKDERQMLHVGTAKDLGRAPMVDLELAEGSYLLSLAAPGRTTVRYPILLKRGEKLPITVEMPAARAIPDGYVYIPRGRFLFGTGSDESVRQGFLSTVPVHELQSEAYLISRYEVTYGDWLRFLNALPPADRAKRMIAVSKGGIGGSVELKEVSPENWQLTLQPMTQAYTVRAGENIVYTARKAHKEQDWLRMPVAGIGPDDIRAYAAWLDRSGQVAGARLCTDREWERAARGADDREFPHGHSIEPGEANFDETYGKDMASAGPDSIGSYPISQSPFGLFDMAGNVFEWVDSSLSPGELVVRGGGYFQGAIAARSTNRSVVDAGFRDPGIGARICARF